MNDVLVKEKSDALTKALIGWTEDESAVYNVFNDVPDLTAVYPNFFLLLSCESHNSI